MREAAEYVNDFYTQREWSPRPRVRVILLSPRKRERERSRGLEEKERIERPSETTGTEIEDRFGELSSSVRVAEILVRRPAEHSALFRSLIITFPTNAPLRLSPRREGKSVRIIGKRNVKRTKVREKT